MRWFAVLAALLAAGVSDLSAQELPGREALPGTDQLYQVEVDSVVVRGIERYSEESVLRTARLRVGERVNGPDVQEAIQRLFATGEFADVRISVTPAEPAIFYIDLVERPVISAYRFQGLDHLDPTTVRDSAQLVGGAALDPSRVERARVLIRTMLADRGFPQPEVDTTMVRDPEGLDQYDVVFHVAEGPRLALARVEFTGNEALRDDELRGAMSTAEEGFFWFRPGELQQDEYERDLAERIPEFYASRGYIDAEVLGDTVVIDTLTGKGRIEIRVNEGERYRLRSFRVEQNRRFPTEQLRAYYPPAREGKLDDSGDVLGEPPVFDRSAFETATREVSDLYRDAGFLQALVEPRVERNPADSVHPYPTVDLHWTIREGQPSHIRTVQIVGNDFTHDRVIRKVLLTLPGDIYSQQLLISSVRNIQSLGFFESLPPDQAIEINPRDDGDIDIVYRVKEKQTGNINFGLSAAGATGLAGFIGYDQPNLFGQAKNGHFRWLFGRNSQDIEASYTDPEFFGNRTSLALSLQSSRDRFQTFNLGDRRQTGGSTEVGFPIFDVRATRIYVGYSLFNDEVSDLESFGIQPGQESTLTQGTRSTLSLRLVRDTRSGGLFPVSGSRNSVSARFTGGFLGGDGEYGKYDFNSEWFARVGQIGGGAGSVPIDLVLGLSFRAGLVMGDNPFFIERFYGGGTQVGQQIRGYEEATVTPDGHIPRNVRGVGSLQRVGESYFTTTAQFGVKLTDNIFASSFIDGGNVWRTAGEFNPADLLVGAGLGVSLVTPFGPIGVDYAYGFDRRDVLGRPDPGWQLHFRFGRVF
ncbi:MAG: outer membrane protein assembly factor BamA [Gemmatimonadota bacterium]